jgi:hypothetical protein
VLVANGWLLYMLLTRRRPRDEVAVAFVLCFLSLPFLAPSSWPHYFVYLPFAQGMLALWLWRSGASRALRAAQAALLLMPSIALSSTWSLLPLGYEEYNRRGYLFFANLLLLLLLWMQMATTIWPPRRQAR